MRTRGCARSPGRVPEAPGTRPGPSPSPRWHGPRRTVLSSAGCTADGRAPTWSARQAVFGRGESMTTLLYPGAGAPDRPGTRRVPAEMTAAGSGSGRGRRKADRPEPQRRGGDRRQAASEEDRVSWARSGLRAGAPGGNEGEARSRPGRVASGKGQPSGLNI